MSTIWALVMLASVKPASPTKMAISVMVTSLIMALLMFKMTLMSWLPFVVVLTFSSGMMTLFIYASTLSPNEKSKKSDKTKTILMLSILTVGMAETVGKPMKDTMKTFSSSSMIMVMTAILIITIVSIATHGYNPQHSVSASF